MPPGVVNVLTGRRDELIPHIAGHREINAIAAANLDDDERLTLRQGTAENLKRVKIEQLDADAWYDADRCDSPWRIEPFVEIKTIWHPSAT